jgi:hypothetical protein
MPGEKTDPPLPAREEKKKRQPPTCSIGQVQAAAALMGLPKTLTSQFIFFQQDNSKYILFKQKHHDRDYSNYNDVFSFARSIINIKRLKVIRRFRYSHVQKTREKQHFLLFLGICDTINNVLFLQTMNSKGAKIKMTKTVKKA